MKQTYELNKRRIYVLGLTADLKDENGTVHHFIDGYEYVEIGGIKWATCNVGAEKETDSGLYFAWGETVGYKNAYNKCFICEDYKYGDKNNLAKYNWLDGLTELEPCDDAVTVNIGKNWRMPSKDDYDNLLVSTTRRWVKNYQGSGINGILFISKEDKSKVLFFPACGYCCYGSVYNVGYYGRYWSSSLVSSSIIYGRYLNFFSGNCYMNMNYYYRYYGFSVRGIVK